MQSKEDIEKDIIETMSFIVLKTCGNCDFRYSGFCDRIFKHVSKNRKACNLFKCWGK